MFQDAKRLDHHMVSMLSQRGASPKTKRNKKTTNSLCTRCWRRGAEIPGTISWEGPEAVHITRRHNWCARLSILLLPIPVSRYIPDMSEELRPLQIYPIITGVTFRC